MGNMSYCRFENTLAGLQDCYEHIRDSDLSESESLARHHLIEMCKYIAEDFLE